jgi:hypothetical protein
MGVQLAEREERLVQPLASKIYPTARSIPGSEWTRVLTAVSGWTLYSYDAAFPLEERTFTLSNAATEGLSFFTISYAGVGNYNSDFVAELLAADAAEPEATFDNVVDMLGWLNRD